VRRPHSSRASLHTKDSIHHRLAAPLRKHAARRASIAFLKRSADLVERHPLDAPQPNLREQRAAFLFEVFPATPRSSICGVWRQTDVGGAGESQLMLSSASTRWANISPSFKQACQNSGAVRRRLSFRHLMFPSMLV